jgi:hypothetical protein
VQGEGGGRLHLEKGRCACVKIMCVHVCA